MLSDEERAEMMRQLKEIQEQIKAQIEKEMNNQDNNLQAKLAARRKRKTENAEKSRELKAQQLKERIELALANATSTMKQRSELDREGLEKIIEELKTQVKADEIPAAIENLVYQKHQKELEDLLLALYEQKAIELREEILAMLEEKL